MAVSSVSDLRGTLSDQHAKVLGFRLAPPHAQAALDAHGLWWVAPFAVARSGAVYGWRRSMGPGDGSVVRCSNGHAVTVAARSSDAAVAALTVERLLVGPKSRKKLREGWPQARGEFLSLVKALGGVFDVQMLEDEDLPAWRDAEAEELRFARRRKLAACLADPELPVQSVHGSGPWSRYVPRTPSDTAQASTAICGNHGLDGLVEFAGLKSAKPAVVKNLQDAARVCQTAGCDLGAWAPVAEVLAAGKEPKPEHFHDLMELPAAQAWEAFAASAFWWMIRDGAVPEEHAQAAAIIARDGDAAFAFPK